MTLPTIQSNAEAIARNDLALVVRTAVQAGVMAKKLAEEHRDGWAANNHSANEALGAMQRLEPFKKALARLFDADVKAFLADECDPLADGWEAEVQSVLDEIDKSVAALKALLPVSADGTLALYTAKDDGGVNTKAFTPEELAPVAAVLDGLAKAV